MTLVISSRAVASEAQCEQWVRENLTPQIKYQVLKESITTFHWVACHSVPGYKKSGDFKKVGPAYVDGQLAKRKAPSDKRSGGFYLATDPSVTCTYGYENPCLVVADIAAGAEIGFSSDVPLAPL
ncbi:MAG: hypothetical protein ABIR96_06520 [Bdellovibrionota bacterium]